MRKLLHSIYGRALLAALILAGSAVMALFIFREEFAITDEASPPMPNKAPLTSIATTAVPIASENTSGGEQHSERPPRSYRSSSILLVADEQEQLGGLGYRCAWSARGPGYCADSFDVQVPLVPIVLKPGSKLVFRTLGNLNPDMLTLFVYKLQRKLSEQQAEGTHWFDPSSHNELYMKGLDPSRETIFRPQLEPGKYVLVLFGMWSQGDAGFEASYGFNVMIKN